MRHLLERRYDAASVFKRAQGAGRMARIESLSRLMAEYGEHVPALDLLPVGTPRLAADAHLRRDGIVRHPELSTLLEMAERFATDLRLYAE